MRTTNSRSYFSVFIIVFAILISSGHLTNSLMAWQVETTDATSIKPSVNQKQDSDVRQIATKQTQEWELTLHLEGMGDMEALLKLEADAANELSGTFEMMSDELELSKIKRQNDSGKLTFEVNTPDITIEFDLMLEGDTISGTVAASDGVEGTVSGKLKTPKRADATEGSDAATKNSAKKEPASNAKNIDVKLDLNILFVGEPDTERTKAFVSFLGKYAKDVATAPMDGSAVELAKDVDVVVLDWLHSMDAEDHKPIGERKDWNKPTVLIGHTGLNLSTAWRLHGGFG